MYKLVSIYPYADSSVSLNSTYRGDCVLDVYASSHPILLLSGLEHENFGEEEGEYFVCFYYVDSGKYIPVAILLQEEQKLVDCVVIFHRRFP